MATLNEEEFKKQFPSYKEEEQRYDYGSHPDINAMSFTWIVENCIDKQNLKQLPDGDFIIVCPTMEESRIKDFVKKLGELKSSRNGMIYVVNSPLYIEQQFINKQKVKEAIEEVGGTEYLMEAREQLLKRLGL